MENPHPPRFYTSNLTSPERMCFDDLKQLASTALLEHALDVLADQL